MDYLGPTFGASPIDLRMGTWVPGLGGLYPGPAFWQLPPKEPSLRGARFPMRPKPILMGPMTILKRPCWGVYPPTWPSLVPPVACALLGYRNFGKWLIVGAIDALHGRSSHRVGGCGHLVTKESKAQRRYCCYHH